MAHKFADKRFRTSDVGYTYFAIPTPTSKKIIIPA